MLSDNCVYSPDSITFKKTRIRNLGDGTSCICNTCSKNPSEILGGGMEGGLVKHLSGKLEAKQRFQFLKSPLLVK